jgi:transaldolase
MIPSLLRVKIFLDGADLNELRPWVDHPLVAGFTSNPSLMRKAGITDYMAFAREYVAMASGRSVSLEVVSSDLPGIIREAYRLTELGNNVFVKIPVGSVHRMAAAEALQLSGCKINLTCITYLDQGYKALQRKPSIVSVFAGRIADTGRDPTPIVRKIVEERGAESMTQILWASSRQAYDVYLANDAYADIITIHPRLFERLLNMAVKDLGQCSDDVVREFYETAQGYTI